MLARQVGELEVDGAIFDGLVRLDDRERAIPDLATAVPSLTNGGISKNGRTIVYHLRRGVKWQDGYPFTAADVAFTFARITDPKVLTPVAYVYADVVRLTTPDPYTVVVSLRKPNASSILNLFCLCSDGAIIPKHLFNARADFNRTAFNTHPIGTGAFALSRWDHGSNLRLTPNPHYFLGAPRIAGIDVRIVASQPTVTNMLASHELDVAGVTPEQYRRVRSLAGYRVLLVPSTTLRVITFNEARTPFDDVRVRRALALALDRHDLARRTTAGIGVPADTLFPPQNWAGPKQLEDPNVHPEPYDPRQAKQLLLDAGWIGGADGVRKKKGSPLAFTLVTYAGTSADIGLPESIQAAWRRIGADVAISRVPIGVMYGEPGVVTDGNYDVSLDGYVFNPDPDRGAYIEARYTPPGGFDQARLRDPVIDRWSDAALTTYDERKRRSLYIRISARLNDQAVFVPIQWQRFIDVVNTRLENFKPEPVDSDLWNAYQWRM